MNQYVYVDWEGRGYEAESLAADADYLRKKFGNAPIWECTADVGTLITDVDPSHLDEPCQMVRVRDGWASALDEEDVLFYKEETSSVDNWTQWESVDAWEANYAAEL